MTSLYIIVAYLGLLILLDFVTNHFSKGTSADFFVVDRSIRSFLLLMSMFGATMTGFALVGSTGEAFSSGRGPKRRAIMYSRLCWQNHHFAAQ